MTNLKLAIELLSEEAINQHQAGKVPVFLGSRGLAALIYDRVVSYTSVKDSDDTRYLLDLAVKSLFAFANSLPDIKEIPDSPQEDSDAFEVQEPQVEEKVDGRWTPVLPGDPLPTLENKVSSDEDD